MSGKKKAPSALAPVVAQNMRAIRGELSQARFARLLGIESQATYQRYESGKMPKPAVLQTAATRLGVSVSELLSPLPEKRAFELQERALMLCFESTPPAADAASVPSRDSFSTPDFCRTLWRASDAELQEAMGIFLKTSIGQPALVIDLCQEVVKTIRQEQRRRAVAGDKAAAKTARPK